jgi:hypothetical protein
MHLPRGSKQFVAQPTTLAPRLVGIAAAFTSLSSRHAFFLCGLAERSSYVGPNPKSAPLVAMST